MKQFITADGEMHEGFEITEQEKTDLQELIRVIDENKYKNSKTVASKILAGFYISQRVETELYDIAVPEII